MVNIIIQSKSNYFWHMFTFKVYLNTKYSF